MIMIICDYAEQAERIFDIIENSDQFPFPLDLKCSEYPDCDECISNNLLVAPILSVNNG